MVALIISGCTSLNQNSAKNQDDGESVLLNYLNLNASNYQEQLNNLDISISNSDKEFKDYLEKDRLFIDTAINLSNNYKIECLKVSNEKMCIYAYTEFVKELNRLDNFSYTKSYISINKSMIVNENITEWKVLRKFNNSGVITEEYFFYLVEKINGTWKIVHIDRDLKELSSHNTYYLKNYYNDWLKTSKLANKDKCVLIAMDYSLTEATRSEELETCYTNNYLNVVSFNNNLCKDIFRFPYAKGQCYSIIAVQKKDFTVCDDITLEDSIQVDSESRNYCLLGFTSNNYLNYNSKIDACKSITNSTIKQTCLVYPIIITINSEDRQSKDGEDYPPNPDKGYQFYIMDLSIYNNGLNNLNWLDFEVKDVDGYIYQGEYYIYYNFNDQFTSTKIKLNEFIRGKVVFVIKENAKIKQLTLKAKSDEYSSDSYDAVFDLIK